MAMTSPSSAHRPPTSSASQPQQLGPAPLEKGYFLRKGAEFRLVKEEGRSFGGRCLVLGMLPAPDGQTRLGLIVSRRYDRSAVQRNRARRLMREAFRLLRPGIVEPVWLVTIARQGMHGCQLPEVQTDLLKQLSRAGVTVELLASEAQ